MTTWTGRSMPTTNWEQVRIGGAYLVNNLGEYILTKSGDKIIIKVKGGDLNITRWTGRTLPI